MQHLPVLNEAYRKDAERLFTRACNHRTRESGSKLKTGRFRLDIKKFFTYESNGVLEAQKSFGCLTKSSTNWT